MLASPASLRCLPWLCYRALASWEPTCRSCLQSLSAALLKTQVKRADKGPGHLGSQVCHQRVPPSSQEGEGAALTSLCPLRQDLVCCALTQAPVQSGPRGSSCHP